MRACCSRLHRGGDVLRLQQDHVGPADRIAQALGGHAVPARALLSVDLHPALDRLTAGECRVDLLRVVAHPAREVVAFVDRSERRNGGWIAHQGGAVERVDGDLRAGMVERVEVPAQRRRQARARQRLPFRQDSQAPVLEQDAGRRDRDRGRNAVRIDGPGHRRGRLAAPQRFEEAGEQVAGGRRDVRVVAAAQLGDAVRLPQLQAGLVGPHRAQIVEVEHPHRGAHPRERRQAIAR